MYIDSHCHLNFKAFNKDLTDVVRRAKEAGVEKIIVPGTDITSSRRAVEIAQAYDSCYAAVGIHPHHAHDPALTVNEDLRRELTSLLKQQRVVAVGEIGLDNHRYLKTKYDNNKIDEQIRLKQKQLLLMQLELAVIHKLPVILHCREAFPELIQTVSSTFAKATADKNISRITSPASSVKTKYIKPSHPPVGGHGVFHCFSGNLQDLQAILTMGYYVGFDGNITYSNESRQLVASTPLQRLLLETDAPYLTPVPHRGKRNEPQYIPLIAQAVGEYQSTSPSEVIHISTKNALDLFNLA